MIGADELNAICQNDCSAVAEFRARRRQAKASYAAGTEVDIKGGPAQSHHHSDFSQQRKLPEQVGIAIVQLLAERLIGRWGAPQDGGDISVEKGQAIVATARAR
tara:strand:+ start:339 stop:650 length:312 start_codon:yes stop_codon:yes gene_type:complete